MTKTDAFIIDYCILFAALVLSIVVVLPIMIIYRL